MCGICGFTNFSDADRQDVLERMTARLAHRGPDGSGTSLEHACGLGHTRLAIIDLVTGDQPMYSTDRRYVTVFNGEIYNYRELREELIQKGATFSSNSDTEVIAEGLRAWGIQEAVLRLRGMFAFAVYDTVERVTYLARDRVGIKPLYFARIGKALAFASEQKALLEFPGLGRQADPRALYDFLTLGFPVTPRTCWRDIEMFPPGHVGVIREGDVTLQSYWTWSIHPEEIDLEQALERSDAVLADSIRFHMRSDVPIAAFLSGGIDSSLVVHYLSRELDNLNTFNMGFDDAGYDESPAARKVAEMCGTQHHEHRMELTDGDPALFEEVLAQYDEPFGDSSCLPTWMICREMRKQVKVVLSGDGGDEMFGGYPRYQEIATLMRLRRVPGKPLALAMLPLISAVAGQNTARRLGLAMRLTRQPAEAMYCGLHTFFQENDKAAQCRPEFLAAVGDRFATWQAYNRFKSDGPVGPEGLMMTEAAINLHADYLRKVDIASSAHGLEVRVPFLDPEVMAYAAAVPANLKIRDGEYKFLLRKLTEKKLSAEIAWKKKWGFGLPFDRWCGAAMREYLRDLLLGGEADQGVRRILKKDAIEHLWNLFSVEGVPGNLQLSRYQVYQRIFMLASIEIWYRRHKVEDGA